ncbi:MAG: arylamine N-acetyltransferase [Salinisphaera sp.]|nr:arylamine N-acetyltransferase [Salinisphaera sp.]
MERLSFVEPGHGFTRRFARFVSQLARHMSIAAAASYTGLAWRTVKAMDQRALRRDLAAMAPGALTGLRVLGVDEVARAKGQDYLTIVRRLDHGVCRLSETRDGYLLESWFQDQWAPLYEVLDFNWQAADFKVANHFTATHPDSHFRNELMVALTGYQGCTTLTGNRLKNMAIDGLREERYLGASKLAEVLDTGFGLSVEPDWQPLLKRVATDTEAPSQG